MSFKNSKYFFIAVWYLLIANTTFAYTHADTLRGSNGRGRDWWDVKQYYLKANIDTNTKSISGTNFIYLTITKNPSDSLQLDLQEPLQLDEVSLNDSVYRLNAVWNDTINERKLSFSKDGNAYWVIFPFKTLKNKELTLRVKYHGRPRAAKNPPWDGGLIWGKDSTGKPWYAVACQGLGASAWWPCKDAQWDKPDSGVNLIMTVTPSDVLMGTCNGKVGSVIETTPIYNDMHEKFEIIDQGVYQVKNPINSYDVTFYLGGYGGWSDTLMGEKGKLDLNFYPLKCNEAKAREQFKIVKPMLHCFEYWMGPYPFYEDGYKLVEAPYLGMEHQSAVAYGNQYKMGYLGMDRSGTGVGLLFDFIIVHESGHEWFGNNVTAYDIADNWIHEGITTYSETLFAECQFGKEKAFEYCRGEWKNIRNDKPIIGDYGVNNEGSSDMYDKGSAVIHMIRMMINDDEKFRTLLHGINKKWYHGVVTSKELEKYISEQTQLNLSAFFNEYLRTTQIPEMEYYIKGNKLHFHFNNVVDGFTLPLEVTDGTKTARIKPSSEWQKISWKGGYNVSFSKDFLFTVKQ